MSQTPPTPDSDQTPTPPSLSARDAALLDALASCGFDPEGLEAVDPADEARVDAILNIGALLGDYPVEDADEALLHATLARIERYEDERAAAMQIESRGRPRFRLPDFITVAAVLLIGASITLPMLSSLRNASIDAACQNNLRLMSQAFTNYANDFNNAMPASHAGIGGAFGWDTTRNLDNLAPLIEHGYCGSECLECAGHDRAGPGYSLQLMIPGARSGWQRATTNVVMGDRNPLVDAARIGTTKSAMSLSLNHGERGQNVLRNDGMVEWLVSPTIRQDNIWLPSGVLLLQPGDRQSTAEDIFLTH